MLLPSLNDGEALQHAMPSIQSLISPLYRLLASLGGLSLLSTCPRVDFLNLFITEQGYGGGCFHQDILIHTPALCFDVAFFFKEAHRFEKRQPGIMRTFLNRINASKIVVSLPLQSLGTNSELSPKYEQTLYKYTTEHNWSLDSFTHGNEIFYIINKK